MTYSQPETELYPEYAEYQKYLQYNGSSSSLYNAFENAQSAQQYLDAPPSQKQNSLPPANYNVDIAKSEYFNISPEVNILDPVALHFNVQTAITDAKGFNILSYQELEDLKKEWTLVESRLADTNYKLTMELKVREAAISISKLGGKSQNSSVSSGNRKSFLFNSKDKDKKRLSKQADDEVDISTSKIDILRKESLDLVEKKSMLNNKILQHHVAILALTHPGSESSSAVAFASNNEAAANTTPMQDQNVSPRASTKTATSRMLSHQRSGSAFPSPPQSPRSAARAEDYAKMDKIIAKLNHAISSRTTSPRQPMADEKLDFIYDLCDRLVDQLTHSKASQKLSQDENEQVKSILSEILNILDPSKQINSSQYKNLEDLRTTALHILQEYEEQSGDRLKESQQNHHQLNESYGKLQDEYKTLQAEYHRISESSEKRDIVNGQVLIPNGDNTIPSPSTKAKSILRQQVESLTASYETNRAELERLELENVDLKTSLQETKFSSQAEIQQLKNELVANEERVQEWKERCNALHAELESVVRSLEEVTRQAVDYESERTRLERNVHELENKLFQASNSSLDKRVSMIGSVVEDSANSNSNSPAKKSLLRISTLPESNSWNTSEPVSVSMLRHEFRRITQEMNAKNMKQVKQLQSEKKKLEHLLRSIKTSSYMGNISPEQIQSLGVIEAN
ncbi:hypothetical protein AWJ20_3016 [Sugiyamaella lignohabitans]|uniref:Uncharacterized protein n=1 Tax=Sugiyamaella lignohabitans TaxID=796027 RepID=A0A167FJQ0_9ASCO|nr:uncharacterized protein AWJ20_3016 [Sugiyamaella lignohabitans]ANB15389.1 hypothetical protein AWJ20_3016 [Sugiyamaella lignohabitans]